MSVGLTEAETETANTGTAATGTAITATAGVSPAVSAKRTSVSRDRGYVRNTRVARGAGETPAVPVFAVEYRGREPV